MNEPVHGDPAANAVQPAAVSAAQSQSILIVEDDAITARYLELGLKRMGYNSIRVAQSSEMALDLVRAERPDLVLMDIQIEGGRDGIDTARLLRERSGLPVIFLSGLADAATLERARDAEPIGYLIKPVKAEDLRAALTTAFQREALARAARERDCWLNVIVDTVAGGLLACNTLGQIELANARAAQMLEVAYTALLQRRCSEVMRLLDSAGNAVDPSGLPAGQAEMLLVRPSGTVRVSLTLRPAIDSHHRSLGVVILIALTE